MQASIKFIGIAKVVVRKDEETCFILFLGLFSRASGVLWFGLKCQGNTSELPSKFRDHRDSNPGPLGVKRERYHL